MLIFVFHHSVTGLSGYTLVPKLPLAWESEYILTGSYKLFP
jgi:hypothetical protein